MVPQWWVFTMFPWLLMHPPPSVTWLLGAYPPLPLFSLSVVASIRYRRQMFDSTASPAPSPMWLSPLLNGMKLLSAEGWSKIHKIMLGNLLLGRVRIVYSLTQGYWQFIAADLFLILSEIIGRVCYWYLPNLETSSDVFPRHIKLFSFQLVICK